MQIVSPYAPAPAPRAPRGPAAGPPSPAPDRFTPSEAPHHSLGVRIIGGILLGATALGLAGCGSGAPAPSSSSVSTQLTYAWMSTADEIALGKQVSAQVEKQVPLWHDAAQQARVERIGARLVKDSSRTDLKEYTFKLLDTDAINAMAVPGGTMYVTRGLLQNFPDDDQVTFVMGHELGHLEARHSVKALGREAAMEWALRQVTGKSGSTGEAVGRIAEGLLSNQFSQANESEADALGQRHLLHLGIDPMKAVDAMKRLQALSQDTRPRTVERIFSDHPPTADRIAALEKGARAAKP
jgi:predicted Zn-dependent protease